MAIYKNDNGTWYVMIRYQDWTGARKQKCKRGFSTRKEAADWELQFKLQKKAWKAFALCMKKMSDLL